MRGNVNCFYLHRSIHPERGKFWMDTNWQVIPAQYSEVLVAISFSLTQKEIFFTFLS